MNNFRANRQGATSNDLADITGALDPANTCVLSKDPMTGKLIATFTGRICNRGLRGVASNMPATFYVGGGDSGPLGMELCRTSTMEPVKAGDCKNVVCKTDATNVPPPGSTITMIVNDAGGGTPGSNRITDECNYENNTATTTIPMCIEPPK
jgi:hypothetical protein